MKDVSATYYIARHLYFSQDKERRMSRPAVVVAQAGMIIGIVVMLLTLFIVIGFKREVREKVIGFGSHIQVLNYDNNSTYETRPITVNDDLLQLLNSTPGVKSASVFATKPGIIRTEKTFIPIILKGCRLPSLDNSPWSFFQQNLQTGHLPESTQDILISQAMADRLELKCDTDLTCFFVEEKMRVRKFHVCGIYQTGFEDNDELFIVGDIRQVQQLSGWQPEKVSGIEVRINDFSDIDAMTNRVWALTANRPDADGNFLQTMSIVQLYPAIFSWLDLLDMNAIVIILLMLAVSGFSIISGLLILILDNIQFIGTMKALGASNRYLRQIFLWEAVLLVGKSLLWGNLIAIALFALQAWGHIIPLDASTYYVSYVPVYFTWWGWLLMNIGTLLVSLLILLAPSAIVTKISPANVMRWE